MIVGRIIAGLGIGMNSAIIPMWQSETSKPEHRWKLIALQLVIVIGGISLTNWMNLGFSYVTYNSVSWRGPLAFQAFFCNPCNLPYCLHARVPKMALHERPS